MTTTLNIQICVSLRRSRPLLSHYEKDPKSSGPESQTKPKESGKVPSSSTFHTHFYLLNGQRLQWARAHRHLLQSQVLFLWWHVVTPLWTQWSQPWLFWRGLYLWLWPNRLRSWRPWGPWWSWRRPFGSIRLHSHRLERSRRRGLGVGVRGCFQPRSFLSKDCCLHSSLLFLLLNLPSSWSWFPDEWVFVHVFSGLRFGGVFIPSCLLLPLLMLRILLNSTKE